MRVSILDTAVHECLTMLLEAAWLIVTKTLYNAVNKQLQSTQSSLSAGLPSCVCLVASDTVTLVCNSWMYLSS